MQTVNVRYVCLSLLLFLGAGLYALLGEPPGPGNPRWPTADDIYAVDSWSMAPPSVERINTADFVTRAYQSPTGATATLTIQTYQAPKLYAAGPEVPFLGNGYTVSPAPIEVPSAADDGVGALVAQRGAERWLVMYAYGERRGLLGNGPLAWALAVSDGILGRPNDYYKLYLMVRTDQADATPGQEASRLAHELFPRVAAWYAS
ncbi:MAG TPA: exosortase-associated EpsI family protein [Chloroflexota bacterium]